MNLLASVGEFLNVHAFALVGLTLLVALGAGIAARGDLREELRLGGVRFHAAAAGISLLGLVVAALLIPAFARHGWEGHESFYLDIFLGRQNEEMESSALLTSPLLVMLYRALAFLPGVGPWSMVAVSLLFGAASIWVTAQLARAWTGSATGGLVAALLVALHPHQAVWASSAYQVILPFLLALCSVYAVVVAVERTSGALYVAAAGLYALAVATRVEYLFLGPGLAAVLAMGGRPVLRQWRAWLPGVAVGIGLVASQLLRLGGTVGERDASEPLAFYLGHFVQHVLWIELWHPYHSPLCWPALALGLAALAPRWRTLVCVGVTLAALHLVYSIFNDYSTRHTLLPVVLLAVVAAAGVAHAWEELPGGALARGLAVAMTVACAVPSSSTLLSFRDRYYGDSELLRTVERHLSWDSSIDLDAYLEQDCYLITEWEPLWERTACGSQFNLADPLDRPGILERHDGCVLWLYDSDNVIWTSRDVHSRAAKLRWLYDWELLGPLTLDDGYEAIVYRLVLPP